MEVSDSKRILFVMESLARGGAEVLLVTIANALSNLNFEVTILCYKPANELLDSLNGTVKYLYVPQKKFLIVDKLPVVQRFYNRQKATWEHRASPKKLYKYYVGNQKFDVEIGFIRGPSIKIISGSNNRFSKKIAWVHTDFEVCNPKSITSGFRNFSDVKLAYSKMNSIVCVSNNVRKSFQKVIGNVSNVLTIYNLISVDRIKKLKRGDCSVVKRKFTVITVGRLIPDKCQLRLLHATKKLVDEGYEFDVWIIGGGSEEKELKKYCIDYHLDNVIFFGMQDNPYVFLKQADIFLLCSKREGFAIVIPEAMTCGLPVVSTKCTGPTEILNNGEFGLLVDNSEEGVYWGMKTMMENPELLMKYKKKSLERYDDFDEKKIIKNIVELF